MAPKLLPLQWLESALWTFGARAAGPLVRGQLARSGTRGRAGRGPAGGPPALRCPLRSSAQDDEAISSSSVLQNRGYDFETTCSLAIETPPRARPAMAKLMARR